jgi:sigma-B regulation protein RsbU (phosphoserine phosphatase)
VEDDPSCALFVQELVKSLGEAFPCATLWVDSAEQVAAELRRNHYDLMLLDYRLPGVNGLQVLAQVRELPSEQQPAVVMLTGSGSESVAVEAMKRGAKDYLLKDGLDATPLMRALRSALAQKRLAEQVAAYNAQMRSDIEMARHLQQSLLPGAYPVFPANAVPEKSALHFMHRFIPATELAGDFFSVFALSDTKAGVFICDVMGHGIRSALVTAMMHALVENEAPRAVDPGQFLAALNRRLVRHIKPAEGPMFVTAAGELCECRASASAPRPSHCRKR